MRLDKLLHQLRFARSRAIAQRWIGEGHMRHNGRRVQRLDLPVATGDVLTLPFAERVLVIEILSLPDRRGPAVEARSHYHALDAAPPKAIAGAQTHVVVGPREGEGHPEGNVPE